ncbi:MAG TPA: serine/threonine-protein kinase, partial [Phototrophicaceae bacterium]|nr:serine/threonine-protein kinase [Phototrophicaceae bacterium]
YGQTENMPYIAMRYLGGGSLETVIRRRLPELNELEKPMRQVAQALDYAHQQGIIHRDLKPGNIMLDENGNAYLSDFGIARVLGSNMTGSMIVGTPAYMSPEQANGLPIDGRSDIYALGVVMFEMLTGHEPYHADTPMAILLKHINEPMPPITDYRNDIPMAVEEVVLTATAKDPDNRYPSAGAMIEALSAALRMPVGDAYSTTSVRKPAAKSATTASVPAPVPATVNLPSPAPQTTTASLSPEVNQSRNGLVVIALLAVVIVVLLGIGGVLLANRETDIDGVDVNVVPTAFPRAEKIVSSNYSISIPSDWVPLGGFTDRSDENRQVHVWQATDNSAYVTLALVKADTATADAFTTAIQTYERQYYQPEALQLIDEVTAEDGTVRRSYRLDGSTGVPAGQLDVFYQKRAPYLAVLELYTADTTGNTLVSSLQLILDSLRVKPAAS